MSEEHDLKNGDSTPTSSEDSVQIRYDIDFDAIDVSDEEENHSSSFANKIREMKGEPGLPKADRQIKQEQEDTTADNESLGEDDEYFKGFEDIKEALRHLTVTKQPTTTSYKTGEKISYKGIQLKFDGYDVTDQVTYSVKEGTIWNKSDKKIDVVASYIVDGETHTASFTLEKKSKTFLIALTIAVLLFLAGVVGYSIYTKGNLHSEAERAGSYLIPQGEMTDDEARAMLDEQVEKSRITVSLSPNMVLKEDGTLKVNFIVAKPNNGLSERLEVTQNDKIVYKSEIVNPGYKIEWGQSNGASTGDAIATVYAVDENGQDSGNPVSVEVKIVNES